MKTLFYNKTLCLIVFAFLLAGFQSLFANPQPLYEWEDISLPGDSGNIYFLHFFDGMEGWTATQGKLYHTTDGGENWNTYDYTEDFPFLSDYCCVNAFAFPNRETGFVIISQSNSYILATTNGGQSWDTLSFMVYRNGIPDSTTTPHQWIYFTDPDSGFAFSSSKNELMLRTFDGGRTWEPWLDEWEGTMYNGKYYKGTGYFLGKIQISPVWSHQHLLRVDVSGEILAVPFDKLNDYDFPQMTVMSIPAKDTLFLTNQIEYESYRIIWQNDDVQAEQIKNRRFLSGNAFITTNTGVVFGRNDIYTTSDGGENWVEQEIPNNGTLAIRTAAQLINNDTIFAGAYYGKLYRGIYQEPSNLVESNRDAKPFSTWPVPAQNLLNIELEQPLPGASLLLYDITGREVRRKLVNDQLYFTLQTNTIVSGIYLLVLEDSKGYRFMKKVVIQKD